MTAARATLPVKSKNVMVMSAGNDWRVGRLQTVAAVFQNPYGCMFDFTSLLFLLRMVVVSGGGEEEGEGMSKSFVTSPVCTRIQYRYFTSFWPKVGQPYWNTLGYKIA